MKNRKLKTVIILLALAGGGYKYQYAHADGNKTTEHTHSETDSDKHVDGKEKDEHAEGGEHNHGDKDEHAHGDKHGHDHSDKEPAKDEHGHGDEEGHGDESKISEKAAKNLNIEVMEAGSATVAEILSVTGRVSLNQSTTAQVKARFPGVIRSVEKEPGEVVKVGDTLATVESNESLQVYAVKSPVSGTVITRTAGIGQLTGDEPLYIVADLNKLWAELFVFSKDGEKLKQGQKVRIQCLDDPINTEATIALILPTAEISSQTVVARAVINNTDNHWRSGMSIRADVVIGEKQVPVAVKTEAIQRMEGKNVVFLEEGGTYKMQPVELGNSDETWTEITQGLVAGQRYVAKNSFIVKADIGKAGAEHEH